MRWFVLGAALALLHGMSAGVALAEEGVVFQDRQVLTERLTPIKGERQRAIDLAIPFAHDSAAIGKTARRQLSELAAALATERLRGAEIAIVGHTNSRGSAEHNRGLSERRAAAVAGFLIGNGGLDGRLITAQGLGESQPLPDLAPDDPANRRVEVVVTLPAPAPAPASPVSEPPVAGKGGHFTINQ